MTRDNRNGPPRILAKDGHGFKGIALPEIENGVEFPGRNQVPNSFRQIEL